MPPHDGMASGTPRPRKLRPASVRIAPATPKVATTISEALTLGRMWRTTMRGSDVGALAHGERLGAHHARVCRPAAQPDHQDDVADARSEHPDDRDREQD